MVTPKPIGLTDVTFTTKLTSGHQSLTSEPELLIYFGVNTLEERMRAYNGNSHMHM